MYRWAGIVLIAVGFSDSLKTLCPLPSILALKSCPLMTPLGAQPRTPTAPHPIFSNRIVGNPIPPKTGLSISTGDLGLGTSWA